MKLLDCLMSIGCSGVVDLTSTNNLVTISSPGYPNIYPANSKCYYYIRAPANNRLILQFTDFNLPTSSLSYCDDSVEIRYYHLGKESIRFEHLSHSSRFLFKANRVRPTVGQVPTRIICDLSVRKTTFC